MKDASHYITVLWVARSLYLFPKLQSRPGIIKVNTDVSMKNPYDVLKITLQATLNTKESCTKTKMGRCLCLQTGSKIPKFFNLV